MQKNDEDNLNPYESSRVEEPSLPQSPFKQAAFTMLGCSVFPATMIAFFTTCKVVETAAGWRYQPLALLAGTLAATSVFYIFWRQSPRRQQRSQIDRSIDE